MMKVLVFGPKCSSNKLASFKLSQTKVTKIEKSKIHHLLNLNYHQLQLSGSMRENHQEVGVNLDDTLLSAFQANVDSSNNDDEENDGKLTMTDDDNCNSSRH